MVRGAVILGGGLTGLVAAERLAAAGVEVPVIERESEPGGACRSRTSDGFTFDHTGHLLHVARPETETYLRELGVWQLLEVHQRRAAVVVGDHVTPYPIQIHTHKLAPDVRHRVADPFRAGKRAGWRAVRHSRPHRSGPAAGRRGPRGCRRRR